MYDSIHTSIKLDEDYHRYHHAKFERFCLQVHSMGKKVKSFCQVRRDNRTHTHHYTDSFSWVLIIMTAQVKTRLIGHFEKMRLKQI